MAALAKAPGAPGKPAKRSRSMKLPGQGIMKLPGLVNVETAIETGA
jgi:hypothetical protein